MKQYLYHSACSMQHSLTDSLVADRRMVVGHVPMDHTCSFISTSHIDMTANNPAFLQVGCSYNISNSRAQQASMTSLAATSRYLHSNPETTYSQLMVTSHKVESEMEEAKDKVRARSTATTEVADGSKELGNQIV